MLAATAMLAGSVLAVGATSAVGASAPDDALELSLPDAIVADYGLQRLAQSSGLFEDAGLAVDLVPITSGPAQFPLLLNGDLDIGFTSTSQIIESAAAGLPIKVLPIGSYFCTDAPANAALIVKPGTASSVADLDGMRIATNTTGTIATLLLDVALQNSGLETTSISYVRIPSGNIVDAVASGQVDAGLTPEPFRTYGVEAGLDVVDYTLETGYDQCAGQAYFTSTRVLEEQGDAVAAFVDAMTQAVDLAEQDQPALREAAIGGLDLDESTFETVNLTTYTATLTQADFDRIVQMMVDTGYLNQPPDISQLMADIGQA